MVTGSAKAPVLSSTTTSLSVHLGTPAFPLNNEERYHVANVAPDALPRITLEIMYSSLTNSASLDCSSFGSWAVRRRMWRPAPFAGFRRRPPRGKGVAPSDATTRSAERNRFMEFTRCTKSKSLPYHPGVCMPSHMGWMQPGDQKLQAPIPACALGNACYVGLPRQLRVTSPLDRNGVERFGGRRY
jgi:hypothetical protein